MGRIFRLSGELANQIAAGEVVERPSSVVKELVENALDAGATRIVVDVEQGGTTLVRVSDDGEGMTPDDALLCLERHATSKITRFTDLSDLGTFGFRGEALPSIASVSRLVLRTRPRGSNEGLEVVVEGGGTPAVAPAGGAVGTTIEVRDLFFNVPARRKFLKATATESAHVSDVLLGMALARYDVTFVLTRDGRPVREHLRATSRAERARAVMSSDGASLVECRSERGPFASRRCSRRRSVRDRARPGSRSW
jgi:DNA mismatch repair protein MutL